MRAPVVRTVRVREHLEALPIVQLEHFDDEPCDRMLVKVSGKVADTNSI